MNAEGNRDLLFARNIGEAVCLWSSVMALQRQPHGVIATMTLRKTRKLHHEVHASTFRHSLKTIMYASVCVCLFCVSLMCLDVKFAISC